MITNMLNCIWLQVNQILYQPKKYWTSSRNFMRYSLISGISLPGVCLENFNFFNFHFHLMISKTELDTF